MNKQFKVKTFLTAISTLVVGVVCLSTIGLSASDNFIIKSQADSYTIDFTKEKNTISPTASGTIATSTIDAAGSSDNKITVCHNGSDDISAGWARILSGCYFYNATPISGISSITINLSSFETESTKLIVTYGIFDRNTNNRFSENQLYLDSSMTYPMTMPFSNNESRPDYIDITADCGYVDIESASITYACIERNLKLAYSLNSDGSGYTVTRLLSKTTTSVTIPDTYNGLPVTAIGDNAFSGDDSYALESVVLGSNITSIGVHAFYGLQKLSSLTLNEGLLSISNQIMNSPLLTSLTIPSSVTSIHDSTFYSSYLTTLVVSSDNATYKSVGNVLFSKDGKRILTYLPHLTATSYSVPDGVEEISRNCFSYCANLQQITLPNSLLYIGDYAFTKSNITSITIPDSVISIGEQALRGIQCTTLSIPSGVTVANSLAYSYDGLLQSIVFNGTLTEIESYAFYNDSVLNSFTFGDGVTYIGEYAFCGCSSMTSFTLSTSLSSIYSQAFAGCSSVTQFVLKGTISTLRSQAFNGTSGKILVGNTSIPESGWDSDYMGDGTGTLYLYSESNPGSGNYWHYVDSVPTIWTY